MLTSFFGKSSPINFLLLGIYILSLCCLHYFWNPDTEFTTSSIIRLASSLLLLIFSMLLLDFMVRKNLLTQTHTFAIFFFTTFVCLLPQLWNQPGLVAANLCSMFALRRIFSLQSDKNDEKKILDASLWILAASLFYFWCLCWFVALFIALISKPKSHVRYYLIPLAATLGVMGMMVAYCLLFHDSLQWITEWPRTPDFDFKAYQSSQALPGLILIAILSLIAVVFRIIRLKNIPKKDRPNYSLVTQVLIVAVLVSFCSSERSTSELIFIMAPAAIVVSGLLEHQSRRWISEIQLVLFLVLPILLLFVS